MTVPTLRPDQADILDRVRQSFGQGSRAVLLVSPTGSGKSIMLGAVAAGAAEKGGPVYLAVHREELVNQLCTALAMFDLPHGRIQAGHPMDLQPVMVASIPTLVRRLDVVPAPRFLLLDEAHHIISPSYLRILAEWPKTKVLGATATPIRLDGVGLGRVFQDMVIGRSTFDLIASGALAAFHYYAAPAPDMSTVKRGMDGDFDREETAGAMRVLIGDAVAHYERITPGQPAIVFCATVAAAVETAAAYSARGFAAASVDGEMRHRERRAVLDGLANGSIQVVTSCDLIGEGLDIPRVSVASLMRPTESLSVHLQQCGRPLRRKDDGGRATIFDHAGNRARHGLPDDPRVWTLRDRPKRSGQAPEAGDDPGGGRKPLEVVDGTLEMVARDPAMTPQWAGGLNLRTSPLKRLLARADTRAEIAEIGRAKGYLPGWAFRVWQRRVESLAVRDAAVARRRGGADAHP